MWYQLDLWRDWELRSAVPISLTSKEKPGRRCLLSSCGWQYSVHIVSTHRCWRNSAVHSTAPAQDNGGSMPGLSWPQRCVSLPAADFNLCAFTVIHHHCKSALFAEFSVFLENYWTWGYSWELPEPQQSKNRSSLTCLGFHFFSFSQAKSWHGEGMVFTNARRRQV